MFFKVLIAVCCSLVDEYLVVLSVSITETKKRQKVQCILGVLVLTPYCYVYLNFVLVVKPGVASASEEGSCLFRT